MNKKIGILYSFFILPILTVACSKIEDKNIKIDIVYDGDTVGSSDKKIRLFGIDTPEKTMGSPSFEPTTGLEYMYALAAENFLKKLVYQKSVFLKIEGKDKYDREVARLTINEDIGLLLVKNGLARVAYISDQPKNPFYTENYNYYIQLLDAQYIAYQKEIGFWQHKSEFKNIFPKA